MMNNKGNVYTNISNSVIGDHNVVNYHTTISEAQWDIIKNDTRKIMRNVDDNTKELHLLEELYDRIVRRDERGFKAFIQRNKEGFLTGICSGIVSSPLIDLIKLYIIGG